MTNIYKSAVTASSIANASVSSGRLTGDWNLADDRGYEATRIPEAELTVPEQALVLSIYEAFAELGVREFFKKYFDNEIIRPSNDTSEDAVIGLELRRGYGITYLHWLIAQVKIDEDSIPDASGFVTVSTQGFPLKKSGFAAKRIELAGKTVGPTDLSSPVLLPKEVVFKDLCFNIDRMFQEFSNIEKQRKNIREQALRRTQYEALERAFAESKSRDEQRALQIQLDQFRSRYNIRGSGLDRVWIDEATHNLDSAMWSKNLWETARQQPMKNPVPTHKQQMRKKSKKRKR